MNYNVLYKVVHISQYLTVGDEGAGGLTVVTFVSAGDGVVVVVDVVDGRVTR